MGQTVIVAPKKKGILNTIADVAVPIAGTAINAVQQRNAINSGTNQMTAGAQRGMNTLRAGETASNATIAAGRDAAIDTYGGALGRARTDYGSGASAVADYQKPYMKLGDQNVTTLTEDTARGGALDRSFGMADFQEDPGYQFRLSEGEKAIKRGASGMGTLVTGATLKALTGYGQNLASEEYQNAYNRFTDNQKRRFDNLTSGSKIGQSSATTSGSAAQNAANNQGQAEETAGKNIGETQTQASRDTAANQTLTAEQIAELETQKANAEATGDIEKANSITDAINAGLGVLQDVRGLNTLRDMGKPAAAAAASAAVPAVAGSAPAAAGAITPVARLLTAAPAAGAGALGGTLSSVPLATISGVPGVGIAGTSAAAMAPGAPAAAGASPVMGLLTNPITAVVAAGIIGTTAWLKSQAHWEANTWVQGFQNKFDDKVDGVNRQFAELAQSGQLDQASAQQIRDATAQMMAEYENQRQKFAGEGKDNKKVADQALQTFDQAYGPQGSGLLGWMDSWIANLPG